MSRVSSMEPVGITKAWTRNVVPNSNSRMVMVHSAIVPRGRSCFAGGVAGAATGEAEGSAVAAAFPLSEVGFITSILLVYQQAGGIHRIFEAARPRRAKYKCLAAPIR